MEESGKQVERTEAYCAFPRAALIKSHKQVAETTATYCLTVLEARSVTKE